MHVAKKRRRCIWEEDCKKAWGGGEGGTLNKSGPEYGPDDRKTPKILHAMPYIRLLLTYTCSHLHSSVSNIYVKLIILQLLIFEVSIYAPLISRLAGK